MNRRTFLSLPALFASAFIPSSTASSFCPSSALVSPSGAYRISTDGSIVRPIPPDFFGFNLEAVNFLRSLCIPGTQAIEPVVLQSLEPFSGAVYRYPGGTNSNYYDWRTSHSLKKTLANGQPYQLFWLTYQNYMKFLAQVGGKPWLVANLNGNVLGEEPINSLAATARSWATEALKYQNTGYPPVLRWELGNELDRGKDGWKSNKYTNRAVAIAAAIRDIDPQSRFVAMQEDFDAHKTETALQYNSAVATGLDAFHPDFEQHLYFDGYRGKTIPQQISFLCNSMQAVQPACTYAPGFWITEFAVTPSVPWSQFNYVRDARPTLTLAAAVSNADFVIALSQIPQVKGAFIHDLAGDGAWGMFYRTPAGGVHPTLPYWAMRLLRESLLDEVLTTYTQSPNTSGYRGGYDLRASILTNKVRNHHAVWMSNRAGKDISVQLDIATLAGKTVNATLKSLHHVNADVSDDLLGNNLLPEVASLNVAFNTSGTATIPVPANSISTLLL